MNLQARVAATQTFQRHLHGHVVGVGLHLLVFEGGGDVDATGTADDELAPSLGVEVHQDVALQLVLGQVVGTKHARLLIGGDKCVDGAMLHILCLHHGHDGGHAHAVVGSQGGATGLHPVAVDPRLDGVGLEVVGALGRLLRHHIHVGLQDHALAVLHARSGRLAHHDVAGRVFEGLYASLTGEVEEELLYFLQMSAGTWNLGERMEVFPDAGGVQVFDFTHIFSIF